MIQSRINGGSADPIRVLLVDDHVVVRSGLRMILDSFRGIQVVGEAGDADSAQALAEDLNQMGQLPHVVLMDLNMRGRDEGFYATETLVSRWPDIAVLIFSSFESDVSVGRALQAGAQGHLLKGVSSEVLEHAVRGTVLGQSAFSSESLRAFARTAAVPQSQRTGLTSRETEIVQFLARSLTNREIATILFLTEATVKTHVANIFGKLGVANRQEAVEEARDMGILDA